MLISSTKNRISFLGNYSENYVWIGSNNSIAFEAETIKAKLLNLDKPCYFVSKNGQIGVTNEGYLGDRHNGKSPEIETLTAIPPLLPQQLGDRNFLDFHKVKYAYIAIPFYLCQKSYRFLGIGNRQCSMGKSFRVYF